MASEDHREFDIIIFGASGYTGRYVIEELAKVNKDLNKKWAVAGRSREKIISSLEAVQKYLDDVNIMNIPIIEANVDDARSISEMCKKAKLILNCVGPYKLYGEVVVAACVENRTHHVDISGEIKYLETTQAKYFDRAEKNGVYIVQACGFDSIPADLGTALLKKLPGDLNSVESYVEFLVGPEGRVTNIGTWLSAVHSVQDHLSAGYYKKLLSQIFNKSMPKSSYALQRRLPLFYSNVVKGWCVWFVGPDERTVQRSQMFCYQFLNERPVQVRAYLKLNSFFIALCYMLFMLIFGFFSLFSFGRYLLSEYPALFSAGIFSKEGPTRKQVEGCSTKVTLCGQGWSEELLDPSDQHSTPPDTKRVLILTGPEPAYVLTSTCMVHAGLTILDEIDQMPLNGGVLTPGAAFSKTSLSTRLEKRGISFTYN